MTKERLIQQEVPNPQLHLNWKALPEQARPCKAHGLCRTSASTKRQR